MSRRSFKTVNVSREVAEWIDKLVREDRPMGIASRDEFVRIAIAILGASLKDPDGESLLDRVRQRVQQEDPDRTA